MISAVSGYYGKLPLSPEFLRLHAAGPELRWLDDWLQRGVLYAKATEGSRWSTLVAEPDLWNFMYVPSSHGRIVCGVLFASHDKAGRSFPFLSFLLLDRDAFSGKPWLVPIVAGTSLRELTGSLHTLRKDLDWNAFCRKLETAEAQVLDADTAGEAFTRYLRNTCAGDWWAGLWGGGDDERRYMLEDGLRSVIRSARQYGNGKIPWGVKFPLSTGGAIGKYDFPFWLSLYLQSVSRCRKEEPGLLSFWSESPQKVEACALVSIGPGSPHMTRFIIAPDTQDDSWRDALASPDPLSEGEKVIGYERTHVLNNPSLHLEKLIEYFSGLG